ncbi:hypothetical protein BJX63DRAFT_409697 [Aspergillus granulosus]|uniref:Uncharacterized protein n=1 Tax=Aspergillus granulosus TaxID=176169 RepID=A0ABR4GYQ7_9EURO
MESTTGPVQPRSLKVEHAAEPQQPLRRRSTTLPFSTKRERSDYSSSSPNDRPRKYRSMGRKSAQHQHSIELMAPAAEETSRRDEEGYSDWEAYLEAHLNSDEDLDDWDVNPIMYPTMSSVQRNMLHSTSPEFTSASPDLQVDSLSTLDVDEPSSDDTTSEADSIFSQQLRSQASTSPPPPLHPAGIGFTEFLLPTEFFISYETDQPDVLDTFDFDTFLDEYDDSFGFEFEL